MALYWSLANCQYAVPVLYHYWMPIWSQYHNCWWKNQYWFNISWQDIANTNIANGNPICSQYGLIREHQGQYRQWEINIGLIYSWLSESLINIAIPSTNCHVSKLLFPKHFLIFLNCVDYQQYFHFKLIIEWQSHPLVCIFFIAPLTQCADYGNWILRTYWLYLCPS